MLRGSPEERTLRLMAVGALALGLLGAPPAQASTDQGLELGTEELPVLGTFRYPEFFLASNADVTGAVHGVRRVDGGTAVYYSVGVPADSPVETFRGGTAFQPSTHPYASNHATDVTLVDAGELTAYIPLIGDTTLTSGLIGLEAEPGDLTVVYAVFPELPATTTTVDLQFEWGATVTGVPVEDGPMEPAVEADFVTLGEGWPAVPTAEEIEVANTDRATFSMLAHVSEPAADITETPDQVEVNLDANVLFDVESADISAEARARVEQLGHEIAERGTGEVSVTGHTDDVQGSVDNQQLSEQRAQAVAGVLEPLVADTGVTLAVAGRGPSEPIADNGTEEGRAQNRRVTVVYQLGEK